MSDSGDTAWILTSSALVLLMTPGLGMFYGGLVGANNVLNTIMMSIICAAVVCIQFIVVGYTFSFGKGNSAFGSFEKVGLSHVSSAPNSVYSATIPEYAFVMFQMTFAMITPALISGAVAGRLRFRSWIIFSIIWTTIVYDLIAHWVWSAWTEVDENGEEVLHFGWLRAMGALDFAGGTVVHITSGFSALVACIIVGKRKEQEHSPHNVPLTIIGASLLWFGWFGFNGGSALNSTDGLGALAILNTNIAACAAAIVWVILDSIVAKRVSAIGAVTGAVVGLVTVTPASGYVLPASSIAIGAIGSACSYGAFRLKEKLKYDDTLDVFGCHGVGGVVGAILTGCFAQKDVNPFYGADGLFFGNPRLFGVQILATVVTAAVSIVLTAAILLILKYTPYLGLRPSEESELLGMDLVSHKEESYRLIQSVTKGEKHTVEMKEPSA